MKGGINLSVSGLEEMSHKLQQLVYHASEVERLIAELNEHTFEIKSSGLYFHKEDD